MFENVLSGIISTLICTGIFAAAKWIYNFTKQSPETSKDNYPKAETVKKMFFISLIVLLVSLSAAIALPQTTLLTLALKSISFLASGFALLFVWGAFDTAFTFYPTDENIKIPADKASEEHSDDDTK